MIFNNYSIRKYVYKFLHNDMSLSDWNTVGGNLSYWLADSNHKVTNLAYLLSDKVFYITNMNRRDFHFITSIFTYYFESDRTTPTDKYIPEDIFVICHNELTYEKMITYITNNQRDPSSTAKTIQQNPASFDECISEWNTKNVNTMEGLFYNATSFNQSLNSWDTSNVISMKNMFRNAELFDSDIMSWNTSKVVNMDSMFRGCKNFDIDISMWDMTNVVSLRYMFKDATVFQQEIRHWDLKQLNHANFLESSHDIFDGAVSLHKKYSKQIGFSTNPDMSFWKTWPIVLKSNAVEKDDVSNIFIATNLYLDDNTHDAAVVTYGEMCDWDVSNVTNMASLFSGHPSFNEDISGWNVSNVTCMKHMFRNCKKFNCNISSWNTEKCTDMKGMFEGAEDFNKDISSWNVERVNFMVCMFKRALHFSYDIRKWQVKLTCTTMNMFDKALNFNLLYSKYLDKYGTPEKHYFNYTDSNECVVRVCVLPGANLVGFSLPGTVEVENDISLCHHEELSSDFINSKGSLSTAKNSLLPLLSSVKCNLAPGLYNNLPIVSNISRGRHGKISLSVTNMNRIEEIKVTVPGKDYVYNDTWNILLDSVKHHLINKKITTIELKSYKHKIKELHHSRMVNGNKKYEISSFYESVWVNVPQVHRPRTIYYRYNGIIENNKNMELKAGKNYVGFTNSGEMTISLRGENSYKIFALNNDTTHNSFKLEEDNFIQSGLEFKSCKSLISDIGNINGCDTPSNIENIPFITRSGEGKGAIVDMRIKGNTISSMIVKRIGNHYKIGDGLEIRHGIKYEALLSSDEQIEEGGAIHISKIREKMNRDLSLLKQTNVDFHFTPGSYTDVPVHVYKSFLNIPDLLKRGHNHDHSKISCGIKKDSGSTITLYLNFVISETAITNISISDDVTKNKYQIKDLCAGDTIKIKYGVFKTFFLSHKSLYQSCKGLNPTPNNLLRQVSENKDGLNYPEGIYRDIPLVSLSGNGSGATLNVVVDSNQKITSVDIVNIGFGYAVSDTVSLPVLKLVSDDHDQDGNVITRSLDIQKDTYIVDSALTSQDSSKSFVHKIEGTHRGYIIECKNSNASFSYKSTNSQMFVTNDNSEFNSESISTSQEDILIISSLKHGTSSFTVKGEPIFTKCLLIGGGGAGGKLNFGKLHKGSNGGSAGTIATGSFTLHEGEIYNLSVGEGGTSQIQPEDSELENGTESFIRILNTEEEKYLEKYPALRNNYKIQNENDIVVQGGISGNNKERNVQSNYEVMIGGDKWRFDRNTRNVEHEASSETTEYVGGSGGGGVLEAGLPGTASTNDRTRKGTGGIGGNGMQWSPTGLLYGSGGSGCPNWGKPWQKVTRSVLSNESKQFQSKMDIIEQKEKQFLLNKSYKLKNAQDASEANEINKMYESELKLMKNEMMKKLEEESLYIHTDVPTIPWFSRKEKGGGGGAISEDSGTSNGEKNTGSGGCAGYWKYGTRYPLSDEVINHSVLEPGNGGSGVITFVYE